MVKITKTQPTNLGQLPQLVTQAANEFRAMLVTLNQSKEGFTREQYVRFLNMQYHLTKGVQRPFLECAAHSDLAHRKNLREFLFRFANEEELHYKIAEKDLENMGEKPIDVAPLDVQVWWAFFEKVIREKPFVRLGAACILENISSESSEEITKLFARAKYVTPKNIKFVEIHKHEELPHGDEIFKELSDAELESVHISHLEEGARIGRTFYLRLMSWVLYGEDQLKLAA